MSEHTLDADGFKMTVSLKIYEEDIQYASNTTMSVFVDSDGFTASTRMDIDIKQFATFANDLKSLYDKLKGTATIFEPYGLHKFISFSAGKTGYIGVEGYLCDDMKDNELFFRSGFDQTFLRSFAEELAAEYSKYADIKGE